MTSPVEGGGSAFRSGPPEASAEPDVAQHGPERNQRATG